MKFRYKKYGKLLRPVIPIKVKNGSRSVYDEVLVDSGADICIFDSEIGDLLNINYKKGERKQVGGVAGQVAEYFLYPIEIKVGGRPYKIIAGFLPNVAGGSNYGLMGQTGLFDRFMVKFDLIKEEIELKERS